MRRISVTYVFDSYCGWCYGFAPALRAFADANSDRIDLRVLSAGLYTGPRGRLVALDPNLAATNARITQLFGARFGSGYAAAVAGGSILLDSLDAAAGVISLHRQPGIAVLDVVQVLQRAWFVDGRSLSDPQVYRDLAAELGANADAVTTAFADPGIRAEAAAQFQRVRELGVRSYPCVLLHDRAGVHRLGGALSSGADLTAALRRYPGTAVA